MSELSVALQAVETNLPGGGAGTFVWVGVLAVIIGLYVIISRTRKRSERAYWERKRREQEMRDKDPDMRSGG